MIQVRYFVVQDIELLNLEEDWMKERYKAYLTYGTGPAWVIEDENGPLAAFGAAILWQGVGEAWFNLIRRDKIFSVIRIVKKYLKEQLIKHNGWRLHATVKCDFTVGQRFLEALGFTCETPDGMRGYNPDGSTAFLYSLTRSLCKS